MTEPAAAADFEGSLRTRNAAALRVEGALGAVPVEPYRTPLSILVADPDGPGGFSDEDGDGRYDDLAAGNSAILTLSVGFDPTCIACNNALAGWYIGSRVTFTNTCGNTVSSPWPNNLGSGIAFSVEGFEDTNEFLLEAGNQYDFEYGLDMSFAGLDAQCPNDSFILHFILPELLAAPAGFQPTLDGTALPNWAAGETLYLLPSDNPGSPAS